MKRNLVFATMTVVLFGSLALVASAHPRSGQSGERRPMRGLGLRFLAAAERLDLSDEQGQKLRDIRRSAPGKIMPKKQAVLESRMDLHDLMRGDGTDTNTLRQAHKKLTEARSALQEAQFDLRLLVREVLTPEQREELRKPRHRRGRQERVIRELHRELDSDRHF